MFGKGNVSTTIIRNCYNTGIIQEVAQFAGGIVGTDANIIENCYNTGDVTAKNYAGGISGNAAAEIKNCYNTGNVTATDYVGGICASIKGKVINCYNTGTLRGKQAGGIAGKNETSEVTISNCFNVGDILYGEWRGMRRRNIRLEYI